MTTTLVILIGLTLYAALFFVLPKFALIFAPFAVLYVTWRAWRWSPALAVLLALVLGGLPAFWIHNSISQFRATCVSVPKAQVLLQPPPQDGFLLDSHSIKEIAISKFISTDTFLEQGTFAYVEEYAWSREYARANGLRMEYRRRYPNRLEVDKEQRSAYIFVTEVAKIGEFGAPLYEVRHSIRRTSDSSTVSTATDIVFGGGIIGSYIALSGAYAKEDQDAVLISCGYADGEIGSWRPQNISDPRWTKYKGADLRFLSSVLKHRG